MKTNLQFQPTLADSRRAQTRQIAKFAIAAAVLLPCLAIAQDLGGADTAMCSMLKNINTILNLVSLVVVTIAVVFAGYQIAFNHKRIAEVAPVLIGGVLIGAASQIAKLVVGSQLSGSGTSCLAVIDTISHSLQHLA